MKQPAIILITCDELLRTVLGCYGGQAIETPNLDRLAATAVRFERAYTVSPWCLPARCSILTGQYPHNSGAYSNFRRCPLDTGVPNLFQQLKLAGYRTSMFGKSHFAPVEYSQTKPDLTLPYDDMLDYYRSLGIDHLLSEDGKQVSVWFYDDYAKYLREKGALEAYRACVWSKENAKVFDFPEDAASDLLHPDAWVGDAACQYIREQVADEPFFSWISFSGPHYPFDPPASYKSRVQLEHLPPRSLNISELEDTQRLLYKSYHGGGRVDGCGPAPEHACKNYSEAYWDELRLCYCANVALIDDWVGNILDAVEQKYGENALILFSADHGEMLGSHGVWGKNNCAYEEVWRIPLLVRYPGQQQGSVSDAMVNSLDILPTCLEAAGAPPVVCDGINLTKQIETGGYIYTFAEGEGFLAVTDGIHKYIHVEKEEGSFRELLDLHTDPGEHCSYTHHAGHAAILAELRGAMLNHLMPTVLP